MKILFLTSRLPFPPNRGDKLRVFNFLSRLGKNHSITLLSFIESKDQMPYVEELKKHCSSVEVVLLRPWQSYLNCLLNLFIPLPLQVSYYHSKEMKNRLTKLLEADKYDAIYAHLFRMAHYVEGLRRIKRILDLCDAISLHLRRTIKFNKGILWPVYLIESLKIKRYEKRIMRKFDEVVLISAADREAILGKGQSADNLNIVPNGVDYNYFKPALTDNHNIPRIAFLGYLSTFYNLDAIRYFYHRIFPSIKDRIPNVRFSVIGANSPESLKTLAKDESVELFNNIGDTRPFLNQASVFICPLRVGSGLQNKILEAMAMGLPVVTTSIGYGGINAKKEEEIIVEDKPEDFGRRVIELLTENKLRNKIGQNARNFIEKNYKWEDSVSKLESLLTSRKE